jgi:hypothetical protein
VLEILSMKRLLLMGFAACAMAMAPNVSALAMPSVNPGALASNIDGDALQVRGRGHGRAYIGRGGRGHHYGWSRGRGHHYGWSRGRHRGW